MRRGIESEEEGCGVWWGIQYEEDVGVWRGIQYEEEDSGV